MTCRISLSDLLDYRTSAMDEPQIAVISVHLKSNCPQCVANLAFLAQLEPALRSALTTEQVEVPDHVVMAAKNVFRERMDSQNRAPAIVRFARRIFDSQIQTAAVGARLAGAQPFQAVYTTDEYVIDLWQERTQSGAWYVIGSVQSTNPVLSELPLQVVLQSEDDLQIGATLQGREFHMSEVKTGKYTIFLDYAKFRIALEDVRIGS